MTKSKRIHQCFQFNQIQVDRHRRSERRKWRRRLFQGKHQQLADAQVRSIQQRERLERRRQDRRSRQSKSILGRRRRRRDGQEVLKGLRRRRIFERRSEFEERLRYLQGVRRYDGPPVKLPAGRPAPGSGGCRWRQRRQRQRRVGRRSSLRFRYFALIGSTSDWQRPAAGAAGPLLAARQSGARSG